MLAALSRSFEATRLRSSAPPTKLGCGSTLSQTYLPLGDDHEQLENDMQTSVGSFALNANRKMTPADLLALNIPDDYEPGQHNEVGQDMARKGDVTTQAVTGSFGSGIVSVFGDALNNNLTVSRNAVGTILVNGGAVSVTGGTPTVANTSLIQVFGQGGDDTIT